MLKYVGWGVVGLIGIGLLVGTLLTVGMILVGVVHHTSRTVAAFTITGIVGLVVAYFWAIHVIDSRGLADWKDDQEDDSGDWSDTDQEVDQ